MTLKRKLFLLLLLFISYIAIAQAKPGHDLVVLFTHDLHSNLDSYMLPSGNNGAIEAGGYARLATAINNERKGKEGKVLVLDGGDFSMGTLFHTIRSTHSPELISMGLMGYDATTFGNHEFEFGPGHLAQALSKAKANSQGRLPVIVASNTAIDTQTPELTTFRKAYAEYPVLPYLIIKRSGLRIGIFGLMGKDAAIYAPEAKPVTFSGPLDAARRAVDMLRNKERVDMVICLSHSGTWADKSISEDEILAKAVPGIDVIISGHTHSVLNPYIQVGSTYIVSSGSYGRYLGRLAVSLKPDGSFRVQDYKIIPITSALPEDQKISGLVDSFKKYINEEYLGQFNYHYGQILAGTSFSMADPDWGKGYDRAKFITSGLGDLVGDAFRYAVKKTEGRNYRDISLVFEGFGQVRVPLAKGKLTVNDAFRLLALGIGPDDKAGSSLVTFWLTGDEIKKLFEIETTFAPTKYDMRLQVTGMRFYYDPEAEPFARVRKVEVQSPDGKWQLLENGRLYRVCSNWKTIAMRQNLQDLSGGKIAFILKDETGKPIDDIKTTRVFTDTDKPFELKEWFAIAMYLQYLPAGDSGLPEIPAKYRQPQENVLVLK